LSIEEVEQNVIICLTSMPDADFGGASSNGRNTGAEGQYLKVD